MRDELVDHRAQRLGRRLGARVGLGDDAAGLLERLEVGRRAVGQALLGAQHLLQAVGALAAEDLHRLVERQVVLVLARQGQVADADLGLHRVRLVDHHQPRAPAAAARGGHRRHVVRRPVPNTRCTWAKAASGVMSPTTAIRALFGDEPGLVELHEVLPRERAPATPPSRHGMPYGWKPKISRSITRGRRRRDPRRRPSATTAPAGAGDRSRPGEGRVANDVGHQLEAGASRPSSPPC